MKLVEWSEKYSVGVPSIDEQHKQFVTILNKLHDGIVAEQTHTVLKEVLEELLAYTEYHFAYEEKYLDEFACDIDVEHHKQSHRKALEDIKGFYQHFENKEVEVSFELIDYLEDWLINHVEHEDQKYIPCFKSHNLK